MIKSIEKLKNLVNSKNIEYDEEKIFENYCKKCFWFKNHGCAIHIVKMEYCVNSDVLNFLEST